MATRPRRIPDVVRSADEHVEVHVVGPGFGEGILVIIGGVVAVGVDCCGPLIQDTATGRSYLETVISRMGRPRYLYWLLTHFHWDHFQGLSRVLERFGSELVSVIVPFNYTEADLSFDIAKDAEDETGTKANYFRALDEYSRVREAIDTNLGRGVGSSSTGVREWFATRLHVGAEFVPGVSARVYAPEPGEMSAVVGRSMRSLFRKSGRSTSRHVGNFGSYVLHITAGDFDGLFLGDAPAERTASIDWLCDSRGHGSICLKVAHHGAIDGTNEDLLRSVRAQFGSRRAQKAVLAPFTGHRLPKREVIDMLEGSGFEIRLPRDRPNRDQKVAGRLREQGGGVVDIETSEAYRAWDSILVERFSLHGGER